MSFAPKLVKIAGGVWVVTAGFIGYRLIMDNTNIADANLLNRKGEAKKLVSNYIDNNKVMIFSTTTCGACTRAKIALEENNIHFESLDMDVCHTLSQLLSNLS